ncbi:5-methyltetrahydropteroyltriglutamate--homocysteine methyltransferase-like [Amphiura filiformis]|uniref:5-methyltetrahydropteroyltriglutamate-- homocysteine methyltransferase-like n=1 Tax=Amphiura filiformis TaxID=82378 RepID=UPI003B219467
MPLQTTVVGAYACADYLHLPTWFPDMKNCGPGIYDKYMESVDPQELETCIEKAEREVIGEQIDLGIDIITDGELRRENYIWYFCRRIKAFDFKNLMWKECRKGGWSADVPVIAGKIECPDDVTWIGEEWKKAQAKSSKPLKMTVPGPMTIISTTANKYYSDEKELCQDLAIVINAHILQLVEAGCKHIQLDEPVFAREPANALAYGMDNVVLCFQNVGPNVARYIHLCRGYPDYMDHDDYVKADKGSYLKLADKLDGLGFDGISIEDAECKNDLSLLDHFKKSKIILGSVTVARSRVESTQEIRSRLQEALKHIPAERLLVAPDCGLGFLPRDILKQKLANMVTAAKSLP